MFRRITSSGTYIAEIDGLRCIAILSVLFFHIGRMSEMLVLNNARHPTPSAELPSLLISAIFHGDRGVSIFFAISGFVLGIPFAREHILGARRVSLKQYFLRRLTRIEPPYMISQLMRLYPVMVARSLTFLQILPHFLAGLFYVHLLIYHAMPEVQLVGWSLEIEVQFYLLAPLLALAFLRGSTARRRIVIYGFLLAHCLVVFAVGGAGVGSPESGGYFSVLTVSSIVYWIRFFLAGFAVADLYVTILPGMKNHWLWDAISLPGWILCFLVGDTAWALAGPFLLIALFLGAFKGEIVPRLMRVPLVAVVGGMCYSIYLTHSIALQAFYRVYLWLMPFLHGFYVHLFVAEILVTPFLLAVGAAYFVLIERPCMDKQWPQKLSARLQRIWLRPAIVSETGDGTE